MCSRLFRIVLSVCDASLCATTDWIRHAGWKYVLGGDGWSEGVSARCSNGSRRVWRSPWISHQAAFLTLITACNVFTCVFLCTGERHALCHVPSWRYACCNVPLVGGWISWSHVLLGRGVGMPGPMSFLGCQYVRYTPFPFKVHPGRYNPPLQCWHLIVMRIPSHIGIPKWATKVKFLTPWYFLFAILFSFHEV